MTPWGGRESYGMACHARTGREDTPAVCPYAGGLGCGASVLVAGFVGAGQVVLPGCPGGAGMTLRGEV